MLLAARLSAVTKKPRLRLTISRSSSVRPPGFFHSSMSRCMLISCGIQWLAQPARYLSHAHRYLNGTSWLTSAWPLMTRLSSRRTRPVGVDGCWRSASRSCTGSRERMPPAPCARIVAGVAACAGSAGAGERSSSNVSIACVSCGPPVRAFVSRRGGVAAPGSVHGRELLVEELGREVLPREPGDRRQPVVQVELREARAVAQRLQRFAVQLVREVHDPLPPIVELQPHLVVTHVLRLDHVPGRLLVAGQRRPPFREVDERAKHCPEKPARDASRVRRAPSGRASRDVRVAPVSVLPAPLAPRRSLACRDRRCRIGWP